MSKQSGLGDNFYLGGNDLSGDVASLDQISGGPATLDVTGLKSSANERIGGLRDGDMQFTTYFDVATEHPVLSTLPLSSVVCSYLRGTAQGNTAACLVGRQINYDGTRDNTGGLTMKVEAQADHFGLEWGTQITPGIFSTSNSLTGQTANFEGGIGTWVVGLNAPTLAASTAHAHGGTGSMSMTSTTAGAMSAKHVNAVASGVPVAAGTQLYLQAWFLAGATVRNCQVAVNWYNSGGTLITTTSGTPVANNASTWTLADATLTAPALAVHAVAVAQVNSVAGSGEVHFVDDVEVLVLPASFDTGLGALLTGNASTFEGGIANWITAGNCSIAQSAAAAHSGTHSLALTSTVSGEMDASSATASSITTLGIPVTPGLTYYGSAWFLAAATPQTVKVGLEWYTSAGVQIGSVAYGGTATDSTTAWVNVSVLTAAPATAAFARVVTDVATTAGASEVHFVDDVVFFPACGAQAYLQVTAFTGTDCTIEIQDSADGITWANVTGLAFTQVTAAPFAQRLAIANGTALRRFVMTTAISTGGFTALSFALVLVKNQVQVSF